MTRKHPEPKEFYGVEYVSLASYIGLNEELNLVEKESDEMRRNKNLTDIEVDEITRIRAEHTSMTARINDLTVFMRDHYQNEISLGQHANMRDSIDAAMYYMGRERLLTNGGGK